MDLEPTHKEAVISLFLLGFSSLEIVDFLRNAYRLDDTAIASIESLLNQIGSEIYTEQVRTITEMNEAGINGYRIWIELKKRFNCRTLSQKAIYNHLARLRDGIKSDDKVGAARFKAGQKEKTRHR